MKVLWLAAAVMAFSPLSVMAIEPGFYSAREDWKTVNAEFDSADKELWVPDKNDPDNIIVGSLPGSFTRYQLHPFLVREKHKDLVVVHLGKGLSKESPLVEIMRHYLDEIGYSRIIVTGGHFDGVSVFIDWRRSPTSIDANGVNQNYTLDWFKQHPTAVPVSPQKKSAPGGAL